MQLTANKGSYQKITQHNKYNTYLTQQSLWEGGPSLHTEMLDITHVKTLRSEVTPCIKKANQLHNSQSQLIQ